METGKKMKTVKTMLNVIIITIKVNKTEKSSKKDATLRWRKRSAADKHVRQVRSGLKP